MVQSTEVATATVCPFLFRLSYPFGANFGTGVFQVGIVAHEILSEALPGPILDAWGTNPSADDSTVRKIMVEMAGLNEETLTNNIEEMTKRGFVLREHFREEVLDQARGLVQGILDGVISKQTAPHRILTEQTITNLKVHLEGRLDALLEWGGRQYGVLDWKTGNLDPIRSGGYDQWQMISNVLLANYRYHGDEDDFTGLRFAKGIYYQGSHNFRMPPSPMALAKVKQSRSYALNVLSDRSPPAQKPRFCPVCDGCTGPVDDCYFYRYEGKLLREGTLPKPLWNIRRQLMRQAYEVIRERAVTHKDKFAIQKFVDSWGLDEALSELEKAGIIATGYRMGEVSGRRVTLHGAGERRFFRQRAPVRLVGLESGIPLLACVNESASIVETRLGEIEVEFSRKPLTRRAIKELKDLPIVVLPSEINLTRRMLQPLHIFHRMAGDVMIPGGTVLGG
ncbi:MAG: PD-(D/E)XK nuclease family protein [Thaumarchaeota archaeon]|nr:PD-(D/E)XK nuclease family protein [Nitrososphaerota archaeon]